MAKVMPKVAKTVRIKRRPARRVGRLSKLSTWTPDRFLMWRGQMGETLGLPLITQQDAANLLGVTRRQVANWEGMKTPIDRRTVLACEALSLVVARLGPNIGVEVSAVDASDVAKAPAVERANSIDEVGELLANPQQIRALMGVIPD